MKSKIAVLFIGLLLFSVFSSGCVDLNSSSVGETVTVTDMTGREVEVPTEIDEVVGIEAGALRLLVYMQATDMVTGVENFEKDDGLRPYIMAHPELQDKTSIGPIHGGNPELIMDLDPDVIFWTDTEAGDADDLQEKTGIPVVALRYGDLDDNREAFYEALDLIGKVLDKRERSEKIQNFIDDTISDLNQRTDDIPDEEKPSCYVGGIGYKGAHGIKSTEPDYSPFEFVNAKNVAGELKSEHAMVDPEKIVDWNPEKLFIDEGGYDLLLDDIQNNDLYKSIDAIKNNETYAAMPYNYYTANYGTILADGYYVGKVLFPESFEDVNPKEKADEIYKELVGEEVYSDMKEKFGGFKKVDLKE
ncbi:MAG: iron ABC transporter substrate-binding protein [Thermoplasmata archaeon]